MSSDTIIVITWVVQGGFICSNIYNSKNMGSGLGSTIMWVIASHHPSSWSSHSVILRWPQLFSSSNNWSYHSSSLWHHPSQSYGSTHGHGLRCRSLDLHASMLVFTESRLERPLGLPNVGLGAFFTRNLINHSCLFFLQNAGLDLH